jgi:hypothetical protein
MHLLAGSQTRHSTLLTTAQTHVTTTVGFTSGGQAPCTHHAPAMHSTALHCIALHATAAPHSSVVITGSLRVWPCNDHFLCTSLVQWGLRQVGSAMHTPPPCIPLHCDALHATAIPCLLCRCV